MSCRVAQMGFYDMATGWFLTKLLSWSNDSWIYHYLCHQCPSPLRELWVLIPLMAGCTRYNIMGYVCQWLATCRLFSLVLLFPSPIKLTTTITEILLQVVLNTIPPKLDLKSKMAVNAVLNFFRFGYMMFNATFNNISVIWWLSVLLVGETGVNHRPIASH